MFSIDKLLTNEYAFTFVVTFISIFIKGVANKHEGMNSVLKAEAYDFGPELVFISLSFAVSKLSQFYPDNANSPYVSVLHTIIIHLFILVLIIVFLKRISFNKDGSPDVIKGMMIPLLLGFISLYVVLTYTVAFQ